MAFALSRWRAKVKTTDNANSPVASWLLQLSVVFLLLVLLTPLRRALTMADKNKPQPAKGSPAKPTGKPVAPPPRPAPKAAPAPPPPPPEPEPEEEIPQDEEQQTEDQDSEPQDMEPADEFEDPCDNPEFKEALDKVHAGLQQKYAACHDAPMMGGGEGMQGVAIQFILPLVLTGLNWLRQHLNKSSEDKQQPPT
jgi:outer membrane biosynthesis protein TonB